MLKPCSKEEKEYIKKIIKKHGKKNIDKDESKIRK